MDFFSKSTFLLNLIFTTLAFEADTPKGRQKDCDARWTKKNNETHYGYKNHAKVDAKSKLVGGYTTTPANVHDSKVLEELVDGPIANDRPATGRATQWTLQSRLQYGPLCMPLPLNGPRAPKGGLKRPNGIVIGAKVRTQTYYT